MPYCTRRRTTAWRNLMLFMSLLPYFSGAAAVSVPLSASIEPESVATTIGASLELSCAFSPADGALEVQWFVNGKYLLTEDAAATGESGRSTLSLSDIGVSDLGVYQCLVISQDHQVLAQSLVSLEESAAVVMTALEERAFAPGAALDLECSAYGNPQPEVSWSLNEVPLQSNGDILIVSWPVSPFRVYSSPVAISHAGMMTCAAGNMHGADATHGYIRVYGPLDVLEMEDRVAIKGTTATIPCFVAGYPILSFTWYHGGNELDMTDQTVGENGTLTIPNVRAKDEGSYTCEVSDGQTTDNSTFWITVKSAPTIRDFDFLPQVEGTNMGKTCVAISGDQPIEMAWKKDGKLVQNLDNKIGIEKMASAIHMYIHGLDADDAGNYSCVATNEVATVVVTRELRVLKN